MPKIHAIVSQKGGVGKTTVTMNLAATVAAVLGGNPEQCPVLVVSTDPQASAYFWAKRADAGELPFDYDQLSEGSADDILELRDADDYRHVFIDTPGSLARPAALARVLEVSDDIVVPCVPEPLAYQPTERTIRDHIGPAGVPYRVVVNNWDPRDGRPEVDALFDWLGEQQFDAARTVIRRYKMHTTGSSEGRVVTQYPTGRVATEAKNDFLSLALELGYGGQV